MATETIDRTILYLTDSELSEPLASTCRRSLQRAAGDIPIVSVSQKPLEFGTNVCVGEIGRSPRSLYTQVKEGLKAVKTKWTIMAEHDCIYSNEHMMFTPPDDRFFWYNDNVWLVQYKNVKYPEYDGMYSYVHKRRVQSQLICNTQLFLQAAEELLPILGDPAWFQRYIYGRVAEPGAANLAKAMRLSRHSDVRHLQKAIKKYIVGYQARDFKTTIPNLDIRHGENFTGQRRGKGRRWELEPWGRLEDVLNV